MFVAVPGSIISSSYGSHQQRHSWISSWISDVLPGPGPGLVLGNLLVIPWPTERA